MQRVTDDSIAAQIERLVDEEHRLRTREEADSPTWTRWTRTASG